MIDHGQIAREKFLQGYTCAQAVFCAFAPEMGVDEQTALALTSSFGGGMGKLRLVCGALSGAFMVLGVDSAMAYCERHPDGEGYLIVAADSGKYAIEQSFEEGDYK